MKAEIEINQKNKIKTKSKTKMKTKISIHDGNSVVAVTWHGGWSASQCLRSERSERSKVKKLNKQKKTKMKRGFYENYSKNILFLDIILWSKMVYDTHNVFFYVNSRFKNGIEFFFILKF